MNSALTKNNKNILDLVKFIMAICVVAIHTHPLEGIKNPLVLSVYNSIVSLAVPFFFLCSGYLLARKMKGDFNSEENTAMIRKTLIRILKMYLIWSAIYLPLAIWDYYNQQYSVLKSVIYYIRGLVLVGEHYNSWQLWYLLSTVFACIFILLLYKLRLSHKAVVIIAGAVIIIAFATDFLINYQGELPKIIDLYCSVIRKTIINPRILFGLFYFPFGMSLSRREVPLPLATIMFAAGFIGNCAFENIFVSSVCLLISAIGFFSLILRINLKDSKIYFPLRKASTYVYLIHMYVFTAVCLIVYHKEELGFVPFIITSLISIVISFIYISIKKRKNAVS